METQGGAIRLYKRMETQGGVKGDVKGGAIRLYKIRKSLNHSSDHPLSF